MPLSNFDCKVFHTELPRAKLHHCHYCQKKIYTKAFGLLPPATIDHVIPLSKGGPDVSWNRVLCCETCNHLKADQLVEIFLLKNKNLTYGKVEE